MSDQFIPLYCFLIACALTAGGVAIWWGWKLRHGTLHLLGPRPDRRPDPDPEIYGQPVDQDLPTVPH